MNNFIPIANTMRGKTELALNIIILKEKIGDAIEAAANNGEYWCHYTMPTLVSEETVDNIVSDLLENGYRVKVTFNKTYYLTILWAPDGAKVVFDGEEWK